MKVLGNGWVEAEGPRDFYQPDRFWIDAFPPIEDKDLRRRMGMGPEGRRGPIHDYDDGGLQSRTWLNVMHNKAALLKADGTWMSGGTYRLWISPGSGELPYEVESRAPFTWKASFDAEDARRAFKPAYEWALQVLGLPAKA